MRRLGEGGIVPASERPLVTYAVWRLLLICLVAAAAETVGDQFGLHNERLWIDLFAGAAVYILTQDLDRPRPGSGRRAEIRYWRGRKVEDDDGPRRWN